MEKEYLADGVYAMWGQEYITLTTGDAFGNPSNIIVLSSAAWQKLLHFVLSSATKEP